MHIEKRLRRLEKSIQGRGHGAVFSIMMYENDTQKERRQRELVDEYIKAGNPYSKYRIFTHEIPFPGAVFEEGFISGF